MCARYGHVARLRGGFFGLQKDALYITDPLALHSILVRDQRVFEESTEFRGLFGIIHHGEHTATAYGAAHKRLRRVLNPIFTAAFVSKLSPIFYKIGFQLRDRLAGMLQNGPAEATNIDMLDLLTRTALELISQGGLGHSFNSFEEDSKEFDTFHEALTTVLPMGGRLFLVFPFLNGWRKMKPAWLRGFLSATVRYIPWPSARRFKWAVDTMHPVCKRLFMDKKRLIAQGSISELEKTVSGGKDLSSLLIARNFEIDDADRMDDEMVIATMSSIVLGGQETTAGALSRLLCLMAERPDLQRRLREELNTAQSGKEDDEELDYYELDKLPLLDGICREALRVFAPVTFVWRETYEDSVVPLQFPIRDPATGAETRELLITKGTPVYIGMGAANRSTTIWGADAAELKPERWMEKSIDESTPNGVKMPGIYSNIMTFLGGGRACPGMKFAILEIKLVLSILIPAFEFISCPEEIDWRLGITVGPYVKGKEEAGPSVPLMVKKIGGQ
ncbi:cytochrome P450 [Schizophyllum amplum]|uniref:Cytochrome P450 n=1 Tax=Schizophyllum amplum TaxID=97359 RepID=A0A550BXJ2_9AGAR|nr:cytochrome P450 [Auriculariopsis ampla]